MKATQDPTTEDPGAGTPPKEITADQPSTTPNEDGPHDVPDDAVIEATLPASSASIKDSSGKAG